MNAGSPASGMGGDLTGKVAFIAGVADSTGYGWAIAKSLAEAVATIVVGTWPPVLKIFEMGLTKGKMDEDRVLSDGRMMEIEKATMKARRLIGKKVTESARARSYHFKEAGTENG